MIPLNVVNESFKRPPTSPVSAKEKERMKIEEDMRNFLKSGGRVAHIERGASHDLNGKGIKDLDLGSAQSIDIW
jgi:hypothetical protein